MDEEMFTKLKNEQIEAKKEQVMPGVPKKQKSHTQSYKDSPLLNELRAREDKVVNGRLSCIVFLRKAYKKGEGSDTRKKEISGYIDYGDRLKNDDFTK